MRRLVARAHLWGGLVSGPLLLVLGLSGSALVFAPEIERAIGGPPALVTSAAAPRSLDAIVTVALLSHPGGEPRVLRAPAQPTEPFIVELVAAGRRLDVAVDPTTLRVVDTRAPERSVVMALRSLHGALHAGRIGAVLVALLGLWLVIEGVTGMWLYGPSVVRRVRGRHRTIHRVVGACALAVGAVVGVTGAVLALGGAVSVASPPASKGALVRLDAVAARIEARGQLVAFEAEAAGRLRAHIRRADGTVEAVVVHADGGAVVGAPAMRDGWDIIRQLHTGSFAGWPLRMLYAGLGLAVAVLSVTGMLIATRRPARRPANLQAPAPRRLRSDGAS